MWFARRIQNTSNAKDNVMPRIAGVNIPQEKTIEIALTYIFGIGHSLSKKILKEAGVDPKTKASALKLEEVNKIKDVIDKDYKIEGDLKKDLMINIKKKSKQDQNMELI